MYVKTLAAGGYEVIHFTEGQPVLNYMADNKMDCLIVDIKLPGELNGIALAIEVRARGYSGPIIVMSGYTPDETKLNSVNWSAKLWKPFRRDELIEAVQQATSHLEQPTPVADESKVKAMTDEALASLR